MSAKDHKTFLHTYLVICLIIILLLPLAGGQFDLEDSPAKHDRSCLEDNTCKEVQTRFDGFIFPVSLDDVNGMSVDENSNGVEDFLEFNRPLYSTYEYIDTVVTLTGPASESMIEKLEALGCQVNHRFTLIDALGVTIPVDRLEIIGRQPTVKLIENVREVQHYLNSAVPLVRASPSKLSSAGYNGMTGEGVTIAVIDSGIDSSHSTFSNRVIAFQDFVYGNSDLDPTNGLNVEDYGYHGTMCASCAAGSGGGTSYKGVAIKAYIISVAVDTTYQMLQGMQWCVNNRNRDFNKDGIPDGPDVITMSMGISGTSSYLDNTAGSAMDHGVVFVTSAGNGGPGARTVTSPATSAKVIAVGATDKYSKQIASFSARGPGPGGIIKPDVVAPGVNINVAIPNNHWTGGADGTSFSGPIVAGVAALLLQYDPDLTTYEVKNIILNSAEDRGDEGPDNTYGHGFLDAISALDLVLKVKALSASSTNVIEDTTVVFSATASGTNVNKFEWDFDNDGEFDLETPDGSASFTFIDEGSYEVLVRITNQQGKIAENTVTITVNNRKPDAKLDIDGDTSAVFEDQPVIFNGSRSWDTPSDIDNLEFSWSFDSGANFTNFSMEEKKIEHMFNKTGEYTVILQVQDDNEESDEESKTIVVQNLKPIANAGMDRTAVEDEIIHFSGFDTFDTISDRPLLNYSWKFGDGTSKYGMNQTHSYQIDSDNYTFIVTLNVRDDDGDKNDARIRVTILNNPPVITVEDDKFGNEDEAIQFNGLGNDTKNDLYGLQYKWIFGDGNETEWIDYPNVLHTYTQVGTYHPVLSVKDPKDAVASRGLNVTINNVVPDAKFTISAKEAVEDEKITFDVGATKDTDSDIDDLVYVWDFGDGSVEAGKVISHRFFKSKRYTILLSVIDNDGAISTVEHKLTVKNIKPTARLNIDKDEYKVNELVRVYAFRSTDTPSDRRNLTYSWDFGNGKGWQTSGVNATHRYASPGDYEIRLKVEDDDNEIEIKKRMVTITDVKTEEDNLANPSIDNKGLYIYTGLGVLIVIFILILVSLLLYYKKKRGIFGKVERMLETRKREKESAQADKEKYQYSPYPQIGHVPPPPGAPGSPGTAMAMTPEQERFFMDLHGISREQLHYFYSQGFGSGQPPPGWPQGPVGGIGPGPGHGGIGMPMQMQPTKGNGQGQIMADPIGSFAKLPPPVSMVPPPMLPPGQKTDPKFEGRREPGLEPKRSSTEVDDKTDKN